MRVLFISGEYPAMQGGVGDYTRLLGQALGALNVDVHVLTSVYAGDGYLRPSVAPYEPMVYPVLAGTGWSLWGRALGLIAELAPDIVHVQYQAAAFDMHPAANLFPWRLRLLKTRPRLVTTFHDLKVPYLFPKANGLRWQAVLSLARGSDAVVLTNAMDWSVLAQTPLRTRLSPIPIGSNIHCEPPAAYDRRVERARWGAGPDDWLLAYFGFLNAGKGGETLVRALAELVRAGHPARLLMVGGKTGSSDTTNVAYLARIEALVAELGLTDRVRWTGFMPNAEVSAGLLAADCAVLPYREGASLRHGSLMAALAHGLPIVTTRAPDHTTGETHYPQIIDGDSALLVPPDDPSALAAATVQVMANQALRQRLNQGGLALSRSFDWTAIAERHCMMYAQIPRG